MYNRNINHEELVQVKNNLIVNRKNGNCKVRVINVILENGLSQPIWINNVSAHADIQAGDEVSVVRTAKGCKLADEQQQPALSIVKPAPAPTTTTSSPVNDDDFNDLLLSVEEKRQLMQLINQNVKVLNHCIKTVAQEIEDIRDKKDLKSLGVTLFISISSYLKK